MAGYLHGQDHILEQRARDARTPVFDIGAALVHYLFPKRASAVKTPGKGVAFARARLVAERRATALRLRNAAPPKVTRQQLRAQAHADGFEHRQWRAAFDLEGAA